MIKISKSIFLIFVLFLFSRMITSCYKEGTYDFLEGIYLYESYEVNRFFDELPMEHIFCC